MKKNFFEWLEFIIYFLGGTLLWYIAMHFIIKYW